MSNFEPNTPVTDGVLASCGSIRFDLLALEFSGGWSVLTRSWTLARFSRSFCPSSSDMEN